MQYSCALAFREAYEQYYLAVGEFQRVVMSPGGLHIDLPEARKPVINLPRRQDAECPVTPDILIKGNLGAGQQADHHIRLADCGESASDGVLTDPDAVVRDRYY